MFYRRKKQAKQKRLKLVTVLERGKKIKYSVGFGNAQDQGARPYQEDSFGYSSMADKKKVQSYGILAVLADGMGGLTNGKAVSSHIVTSMIEKFSSQQESLNTRNILPDIIKIVKEEVAEKYTKRNSTASGSTVTAVHIKGLYMYWLSIGDSRIYLYRNGTLYRVNEDHDYLNTLISDSLNGLVSLDSAFQDSQKDALSEYIGKEGSCKIDFNRRRMKLQPDDKILMCSDGLYNTMTEQEITQFMKYDPQEASQKLLQAALDKSANHQDNITLIILDFKYKCKNNKEYTYE